MNFFSPLGNRGHHFSAPLKTSVSEINGIAITKVNYQPNYYILVQNLIHVVDTKSFIFAFVTILSCTVLQSPCNFTLLLHEKYITVLNSN